MPAELMDDDIQPLKDKNAQLLDEKRKAKAEAAELAEQLAAVQAERDTLAGELRRITIEQPRAEMLAELTVDGMADTARREIEHHFQITDEGEIHREGEPVTVEIDGKPTALKYDAQGIKALHKAGLVPALGHMLKGHGSSGGGATGGGREHSLPSGKKVPPAPAPRKFGLS